MITINTISDIKFSFNGINYLKNFTPIVTGNKIEIINTYDSKIKLTDFPTDYTEFTVDGNTFANVGLLQDALLLVIFTRSSLSGGGGGIQSVVAGTNITVDNTDPLNPVVSASGGGSSANSIVFEVAISQNILASTLWYSRVSTNQNIFNATFTTNASLTPANDFADHPIQSPCNILPFQGKLKKVMVRGHSNISATDVRMVILKSIGNSVAVVASSKIIADKTFNTHSPNSSYYLAEFSGTELDTTTVLDLGTELRVLLFNNNVASNLYTTTVAIEVEEI